MFTTADRALSRRPVWLTVVIAILLLQCWLTLSHQPWLDEYQALQIALQTPDVASLLANLRYEGHPPLWYLMLRGTEAFVPARWVLPAVALVLAVTIQLVLLLRSSFSRAERVLIATSAFVLFEYGAISRSLTLGVALLVVAFAFRERRWSWIALALLPQADVLFGLLSIVLLVIQWRERRWWWPGVALWAAMAITATLAVIPAPDVVPALVREDPLAGAGTWLNRLSVLLLPVQVYEGHVEWNRPLPLWLAPLAGPLFLVFAARQMRADTLHRWLLGGFVAATLLFSLLVYPLSIRHLSLIATLLILLKWREVARGGVVDRSWRAWLLALSAGGVLNVALAVAMPFDNAAAAARFIREHGLTGAHWVSFPEARGQGVAALNGMTFDKLESDCAQDFVRWNHARPIVRYGQLTAALDRATTRYGRLYLLSHIDIQGGPPGFYTPIASIPAGYDGHAYHLYAIRRDLAESDRRAPPCVAGLRPLRLVD